MAAMAELHSAGSVCRLPSAVADRGLERTPSRFCRTRAVIRGRPRSSAAKGGFGSAKRSCSGAVVCAAVRKQSGGDAPGEYGGPPVDLRIRKTWGGNDADPISSPEKYIWNADWKTQLDNEAKAAAEAGESDSANKKKEQDAGFLSIGRAFALDSLDVDLSTELSKPSKATLQRQVAAAREGATPEQGKKEGIQWRFAPTKGEEKKWEKAAKFTTGGSERLLQEVKEIRAVRDLAAEREASLRRFEKLKDDLLLFTIGIGALCDVSAYAVYSPEVALSYAVGLLGAVAYVRMLSSSVEAIGSDSVSGAAKGALGQPRILVPVILVMTFNRWNSVLVPEYGLLNLQLIPMLIGFFTYKAATLVQTFKEILDPYLEDPK